MEEKTGKALPQEHQKKADMVTLLSDRARIDFKAKNIIRDFF